MPYGPDPSPLTRREALASAFGLLALPGWADEADEERDVEAIREQARRAGLGAMQVRVSEPYLAIGDSSDSFRKQALNLCLGLSRDFLKHFKDKGFAIHKPSGRLMMVVLSGRDAFDAFLGGPQAIEVGGVYELETNRLVLFDNRASGARPDAARANTFVLFHEATHQLSFSTGLLMRGTDIPLAIAEGFGTYGEAKRPRGREGVGAVNRDRLAALTLRGPRASLSPVAKLIGGDELLLGDETKQIAYSESWLLVHYLMNRKDRLPQLRAYLDTLRNRRDPSRRLEDWSRAFGDPAELDRELLAYVQRFG